MKEKIGREEKGERAKEETRKKSVVIGSKKLYIVTIMITGNLHASYFTVGRYLAIGKEIYI
jgi:hypothetical protein